MKGNFFYKFMDDLGILIKKNLKAASYNVQNFKSFVNNAYILLSAKLTEQKKTLPAIVLPKIQFI